MPGTIISQRSLMERGRQFPPTVVGRETDAVRIATIRAGPPLHAELALVGDIPQDPPCPQGRRQCGEPFHRQCLPPRPVRPTCGSTGDGSANALTINPHHWAVAGQRLSGNSDILCLIVWENRRSSYRKRQMSVTKSSPAASPRKMPRPLGRRPNGMKIDPEIGRASRRGKVCQKVKSSVVEIA